MTDHETSPPAATPAGRTASAGRTPRSRPRTAARVGAVQALFQSEQAGENPETVIDQFVRHRLGELPGTGGYEEGRVPEADVALFGRIVRAAVREQDRLDALLVEALPAEWPLGRLDPVLRALLRAAGAEFTMSDGPPGRVVINEYLDVAHGFFSGEEPRMANGLLDVIGRRLRPQDFPQRGGEPPPGVAEPSS
ncbi:transcription antitermination factor NusB [Lichenicoccus roseus]|uniref:Transcription antitermination protein NusB n=1 Tax=Lichenicoccus roseus TaxID=2683649 RepID=A0A5R9J490_9PROT|nr:transcription antitermination factor NusB [Lichenicoccus roseus]TLU72440.1 transcription antitermination factor NusB [Lichenicoccus roseus]